jgi:hypothetical protein
MGHEGADHGARLPARQPRWRVVDGLVEAEGAGQPGGGEPLQIRTGGLGRHHQRQRRRIGGDHQILRQPALEPEPRDAEGAVLVVELGVDAVVAGLRDAPGHAALLAVGDLPGHRRAVGLVEQGVVVARHHQQRHQVLEHRAAPGQERGVAGGAGQQAAEGEPALLRQLALRNADEAGLPRLGGQQIVVARIAPPLRDVVADGQQRLRLVEQEAVLHTRQLAGGARQVLDLADALADGAASASQGARNKSSSRRARHCRARRCTHAAGSSSRDGRLSARRLRPEPSVHQGSRARRRGWSAAPGGRPPGSAAAH